MKKLVLTSALPATPGRAYARTKEKEVSLVMFGRKGGG